MNRASKKRRRRNPPESPAHRDEETSLEPRTERARSLRFPVIVILGLILVGSAVAVRMWVASNPVLRIPVIDSDGLQNRVANVINQRFSAVVKSPDSGEAWGEYGLVLMAHEFHDEAAQCYAEAARLDPQNYLWPYYHGIAVAATDADTALRDFEKAVELAPENLSARLRLAEWYYDLKEVDEAAEQYQWVLDRLAAGVSQGETVMYKARSELGMARVLHEQGKTAEALQSALRAVQSPLGKRRDVWQVVSELHEQLGDTKLALAAADAAEKAREFADWPEPEMGRATQYTQDAKLLYIQAELAWSQGRFDQAMEILLSIGDLEPDDQKWKLRLAEMFRDSGRLEDGVRFVSNAIKSHPNSARMHVLRAQMLIGQEKLSEAKADCEKAIELEPTVSGASFVLGNVYIQEGNLDAAVESLQESTRLNPQFAPAFMALGEAFLRKGQTGQTVQNWKRAASLVKSDYEVRMRLAELLVTNGQVEEAAKYLKEAIALAEKANDANRLARAQQLMKKAFGSNDN